MNTNTTQAPEQGKEVVSKPEFKVVKFQKKHIKIAVVALVVVLLAALAYVYKSLFVAATVNGKPISRLAVVKELEKQGGKGALEFLINVKLIDDEAKSKNITVSQEEIGAEIKKYEDNFNVQGSTLDETLSVQGLTREDLQKQVSVQLKIKKLLGDKIQVTDAEVDQFLQTNSSAMEGSNPETLKTQAREQLEQQKLGQFSGEFVSGLREKAKIKTFVAY
jgi:hypothetical protein